MARILERFEIPPDYAGKIEGRSSFARMGLMVHCTGDFINPGWGGYMPLQLYNAGPFPLRIYPFLPICQLMVVKLTSTPSQSYGSETLESKYQNDDGGPSYWWRDRRVARLQQKLREANLSLRVCSDIVALVRFQDPDLLEHFESFVLKQRGGDLESADTILHNFAKREDRRRWRDRVGKALFPLVLTISLGDALFTRPYGLLSYLIWAATVISALWFWFAWFWQPAEYLGSRELRSLKAAVN